MKIEYYEEMLEQEAINKYLNMIARDYNGELAKIFQEKYINKDKEIERLTKQNKALNEMYELTKKEYIRLNNIINELEKWLEDDNILIFDFTGSINKSEGTLISDEEISKKIEELKGDSSND